MGVASTLMSRFCRILPPVTIITICFYFLIKLSLVSNTAVPDPEKWKNHALDFVEEDEEGYIPTFETTAIPTPRQTSAAHIEDLENKGEIGDFADDDEFLPFVDIEDDGDWDEEDLQEMSGGKYENETVDDGGDWSRFAYIQYVTNEDYLCNSVMIFEALHRLGSKADRLLMYPQEMLDPEAEYASSHGGKLLIRARDEYNVTLQPIEIQHRDGQDGTFITMSNLQLSSDFSQKPGPIPSPSSSPSTKPNTNASSPSTQTAQSSNTWTNSSNFPLVPSPCPAHTGSTTTTHPRRSSPRN